MAGQTPLTEKTQLGDLIRYENQQEYTREALKVYNNTGADVSIANPMGYPVKAHYFDPNAVTLALEADAADVIGVILTSKALEIADEGYKTLSVLVRGPAEIDAAYLPTSDVGGTTFTKATIQTALKALNPPILSRAEPSIIATQTT